MIQRIVAITFIYVCCCVAWAILGGAVVHRTDTASSDTRGAVGSLWGEPLVQVAPAFARIDTRPRLVSEPVAPSVVSGEAVAESGGPVARTTRTVVDEVRSLVPLAGSTLRAGFDLEHRRKGLLWHPTYTVGFDGRYRVHNPGEAAGTFEFTLPLPRGASVFRDVRLRVDGNAVPDVEASGGRILHRLDLDAGETADVHVGYVSQGVETWRYALGAAPDTGNEGASSVRTARDVSLTVETDFADVDFPGGTLSPTAKARRDGGGWTLTWDYGTLVSSAGMGLAMPQKLNPGPWVSRVTFFAPVSLFLFFFAVFVLSVLRGVRLHPMHYFFLGAACFAFHLLLAYLVDHMETVPAMVVASAVSVGLVVSYVRLVAGLRFALLEVGSAQVVYLVGFAATFFLNGATGLAVTLLSVATLFVTMQASGRLDWDAVFARPEASTDDRPLPAG